MTYSWSCERFWRSCGFKSRRLVIGIVIEVDIGEYVLAAGDGVWFGI